MKENTLIDLGLSRNESKIYVSLLETGASTITKIADASGIHRVNIYDSLKRLQERGLVGQLQRNGSKFYQAAPPVALRNIIREKEIKLEQIMPQLELSKSLAGVVPEVQTYVGFDYVRNMFLHFLELNKDIFSMNVPQYVLDQMSIHGMPGKYFQEEIHKRRIQQKQMMYHIYHQDAMERIKFLNTLPYTEARYFNTKPENHVTTTICGDEVYIKIFFPSGDKPVIIFIKNSQVADTYRSQFLSLWKMAKKP